MGDGDQTACRRNCWLTGLGGGALLWAGLALIAGFTPFHALFVACIAGGLAALFLVWAFCTGPEAEAAWAPQAAADPAPAPAPPPAVPVAAPLTAAAEVTPRPDPSPSIATPPAAPPVVTAPAPKAKAAPKARPAPKAKPAGKAGAAPKAAPTRTIPAPAGGRAMGLDAAMGRTKETAPADAGLLVQPRGGKGDDLKLIVGIGPALEKLLNGIGVWHFDQIAAWKARDIALVDSKMANFKGRISRDGWVKQARALARGETPKAKGDR